MIDVFLYWLTDFIRFCLDYDFHGVKALDPIIGGAIVSGVGSLLKGFLGGSSQKSANKTNLQIARETNENQYRMFTEGNQFSERMANEAWNRETSYNDPRNQMLRYQRAGINPQVAMSGSLGSAATQPGDMSAPTSLVPPVQHAPTVQPLPHVLSGIEEMSRVVGNLISAKKDNADANRTAGLYTAELENILEDTQSKRLQNAYQYMENVIKGKTGMQKALLDMREQMSKIVLNDQMTETEKYKQVNLVADTFLKKAEKKLTQARTTELNETLPLIKRSYEEQIKLTKKQQATEDSKQAANYASANASNATAENQRAQADYTGSLQKTEDALRDLKVSSAESDAAYGEVKNMLNTLNLSADLQKKLLDTYFSGGLNAVVGRLFKSMKNEIEITQANKEVNRLIDKIKNRRYRFQDK